jgi:hypothetical protein
MALLEDTGNPEQIAVHAADIDASVIASSTEAKLEQTSFQQGMEPSGLLGFCSCRAKVFPGGRIEEDRGKADAQGQAAAAGSA